jgi:tetratricopeptide (TPR) repeat protein
MKISRNQICTCGSGKKYKKCCGSYHYINELIDKINKYVKLLESNDLSSEYMENPEEIFKYALQFGNNNDIKDFQTTLTNTIIIYEHLDIDSFNQIFLVRLYALGHILFEWKKYYESIYFSFQAIFLNNLYHQSYQQIGDCFRFLKQYEKALIFYERGLSIVENKFDKCPLNVTNKNSYIGEYYYNIGMVYKVVGKKELSLKYLLNAKYLKENKYFGYRNEGYSSIDDLIKSIIEIQSQYENIENPSEEDLENTIRHVQEAVSPTIENIFTPSSNCVNIEDYTFFNKLSEQSKLFFKTAEHLFYTYPSTLDYSPVMIEYCKVVETELREKFLSNLEKWVSYNNHSIQTGTKRKDVNKFKKVTLGAYQHLLANPIVKSFIVQSYPKDIQYMFLEDLSKKMKMITDLRNCSAHINATTYEKVSAMRKLLIYESVLDTISS